MPSDASLKPVDGPVIGQVGIGKWGRHILRDLVSLGASVHAVANSPQSISNAEEFGAASIVATIDRLPAVDAAVIAVDTVAHAEVVEAVAERIEGPIFVEKPLTHEVDAARRIAAAHDDRVFVMDKWRYHAGVLELARTARSGEIGELQAIQTRRVSTHNPHRDVNTVWIHAPHDLSIANEILGYIPEVRFATAEIVRGEIAGIHATLGGPPWLTIECSDSAPDHRREIRVVGSEGSAVLDGGWSDQISVRKHDGHPDEVRPVAGELPLLAELRAFVEHVAGGPPPKSSAADGLVVVERIQQMLDIVMENEKTELTRPVDFPMA